MVIGLAANAANNAMYNNNVYDFKYIAVALITLGLTILQHVFKGFLGLIQFFWELSVGT